MNQMNKLLFVSYKKTANASTGGDQCSKRNLEALCDVLGTENIECIYLHDEAVGNTLADYLKGIILFPFNYFFGLTPSKLKRIVASAQDKEYVFIDRSIFGIIAKKLKESGYQGQIICFFHNVERKYFDDKLGNSNPAKRFILSCADNNDRFCCNFADTVVTLNKRDSESIESLYGRKADHIFPITFNDSYAATAHSSEMTGAKVECLFIGSYFPANVEGLEWFCHEVLPKVQINLKVVGKGMEKLEGKLPDEVQVIGSVPQTTPYFENADLIVLPIFSGSGMKVKTCESLMYGKNIAGTSEAFEGYDIDYDKAGRKCDTAEDFISYIKEIEAHPVPRFNSYSRNIFEEKYSSATSSTSIRHILSLQQ